MEEKSNVMCGCGFPAGSCEVCQFNKDKALFHQNVEPDTGELMKLLRETPMVYVPEKQDLKESDYTPFVNLTLLQSILDQIKRLEPTETLSQGDIDHWISRVEMMRNNHHELINKRYTIQE